MVFFLCHLYLSDYLSNMNELTQSVTETLPEPEMQKKPMLGFLAKSIFVDSVVEFFKGVVHFFALHATILFVIKLVVGDLTV